jgi:uncharacterized protein (DUF58 family)
MVTLTLNTVWPFIVLLVVTLYMLLIYKWLWMKPKERAQIARAAEVYEKARKLH